MGIVKDLDNLPVERQRNDKYVKRDSEIMLCLGLEVGKGKEISTLNPGAWKTAFYKKWKEMEKVQKEVDEIDYKSMEFTIQTGTSFIKIWRIK